MMRLLVVVLGMQFAVTVCDGNMSSFLVVSFVCDTFYRVTMHMQRYTSNSVWF